MSISFEKGDTVKHQKSGGVYKILLSPEDLVYIEATNELAYVYQSHTGAKWVRPQSEMEDGRFIFLGIEIEIEIEKRNKMLEDFDLLAARTLFPKASCLTLEVVLHKSRYDCVGVSREARLVSAKWLRVHGYKDMNGNEILPEGELPV